MKRTEFFLYKPVQEVEENLEIIEKIGEIQSKQDTEGNLNETSCCARKERNRNIMMAKKTVRNIGLEKKKEKKRKEKGKWKNTKM